MTVTSLGIMNFCLDQHLKCSTCVFLVKNSLSSKLKIYSYTLYVKKAAELSSAKVGKIFCPNFFIKEQRTKSVGLVKAAHYDHVIYAAANSITANS